MRTLGVLGRIVLLCAVAVVLVAVVGLIAQRGARDLDAAVQQAGTAQQVLGHHMDADMIDRVASRLCAGWEVAASQEAARVAGPERRSHTVPSGGTRRVIEAGWPCQDSSTASTAPMLPTPLPA